jgi:hypothetical protein
LAWFYLIASFAAASACTPHTWNCDGCITIQESRHPLLLHFPSCANAKISIPSVLGNLEVIPTFSPSSTEGDHRAPKMSHITRYFIYLFT